MVVQNAENGVVGGHSRSWAMPPLHRAHTTSYSTFIETMCLYYRFRPGDLSKVANFDPPPSAFGVPIRVAR